MNMWNYVVSVHKPTAVTHCCMGNFTGPRDINLIIAKSTWIEIHSLSSLGLQKVLQVPIYGRIAALALFRPAGEQQDSLVISTKEYKLCVVQWNNNEGGELITRAVENVWDLEAIPVKSGHEIGMVDPDCRVIGLHLYDGVFRIIAYDGVAGVTHTFDIMLDRTVEVVDIKFLYGCSKPTIAVLYQQQLSCMNGDELQVRTYEVDVKGRDFKEMPWSVPNLDHGARMLIPVPMPFGGVIIIGEKTIAYFSPSPSVVFKAVPTPNSMTIIQAYAKVHDSQYLLGDHMGHLHLLSIIYEKGAVTGLNIDLLGDTSVASTICYLENGFVYVGSDEGDSQLVKLRLPPDSIYGSVGVSVVETYVNLGPILDFCVVDHGGQEHVVTCSGGFNDGCLRILRSGIRINEHAAAEFADIKGMWPLRASSTRDDFDTYLVLSFLGETRVLAINSNDELEETHEIQGFVLHAPSLFCQDAIHDQLVQVTASSVRLMSASSGQLLSEWRAPTATGLSITVATGNATQVLLATRGCNLVYLEIGEGSLILKGHKEIEYDVSCMDITPLGQDPNRSELAAVGLWKDQSIRIYSLPDLKLIQSLQFAENVVTRSVLFCKFEGISYLLCGLGDGHLYNLTLNVSSGELSDGEKKKISLGTKGINLRTFRHENATHVLALGDRATVICSSNLRLAYSNVSVGEVNHMCCFHSKSFPNSIVVVKEDMFSFGSIDNIQNIYISSVHLEEHPYRICYQDKSGTFAICSMKYGYDEMQKHFIRLLDEKTFEYISSYPLDMYEEGCSILSCSFTDDHNTVYCCVGTGYRYPDQENICKKGRILVFSVGNRQLRLVTEKETKGAVYNLNAFNGKLVAGINEKIDLYKWIIRDDVSRELEFECGHPGHVLTLCVKTRGDFILVGDYVQSMYLLVYKNIDERGGILEEKASDYSVNYMTAIEFLDDDTYVGADQNFNIFVVKKKNNAAIDSVEERKLKLEGEYHLGALVNQFRRASLAEPLPLYGKTIPTVIFGTTNGMIGLIASLPEEQYQILQKLQMHLVKVIRGVGGLNHEQWRSFNTSHTGMKKLLDGDLIESFLDLNRQRMSEIATAMTIPIDELCKMVEDLASLH